MHSLRTIDNKNRNIQVDQNRDHVPLIASVLVPHDEAQPLQRSHQVQGDYMYNCLYDCFTRDHTIFLADNLSIFLYVTKLIRSVITKKTVVNVNIRR